MCLDSEIYGPCNVVPLEINSALTDGLPHSELTLCSDIAFNS